MRIGSRRQLVGALVTLLVLLTAFAAAVAAAHIWRVGPATVAKVHVQRHAKHAKRHSKKRRHRRPHQVARKRVGPGTVGSGGGGGPSSAEGSSGAGAGGGPGSSGGPSEAGSSSTPAGGSPGGDPFAGQTFYVEPGSAAAQTQQEWAGQGRAAEAAQVAKIASQPVAKWFGDWSYGHGGTQGDVGWWVGRATAAGALPVLVAYDLPWRDCSQFSSGGASSPTAYREFIAAMAAGIGTHQAVVILEPDALAELSCLSGEQQSTYYSLLSGAVAMLSAHAGVTVYLDAGNAHWEPAATIASRLEKAGVAGARGFSLNVSNFDATSSEVAYGEAVVHDIGASGASPHFIVDTSRNGRGAPSGGEWCNPPGRGLGADPTASTGNPLVDAFFWVKSPGQSDGNCNGGPNAGEFWPAYALELARNSAG